MESGDPRNPVIVIPGVLGTRLLDADSQRTVWGAFAGNYANPRRAADARLIAHPMGPGPLSELRDANVPDGVLESIPVSILGIPINLRAYLDILRTLGVGGYRDRDLGTSGGVDYGDKHFTCFQFAYDWRRDTIENARLLDEYIAETRDYVADAWREQYGIADPDVRFDIVAHSMGGLLARYFLRYGGNEPTGDDDDVPWTGAEHIDRVVMVGTPNAGSLDALIDLVRGRYFAPTLPRYPAAILGTMPGLYQLLPRPRHAAVDFPKEGDESLDLLDPVVWHDFGWGLADPEQDHAIANLLPGVDSPSERRAIAIDHLDKCLARARQFFRAIDRPATPPARTELYAIVGDAVPTTARIAVDLDGDIRVVEKQSGDGVVLRRSVLMDERVDDDWQPRLRSPIDWKQVLFLFSNHLELTRDPAFVDNVLYLLLEDPR